MLLFERYYRVGGDPPAIKIHYDFVKSFGVERLFVVRYPRLQSATRREANVEWRSDCG